MAVLPDGSLPLLVHFIERGTADTPRPFTAKPSQVAQSRTWQLRMELPCYVDMVRETNGLLEAWPCFLTLLVSQLVMLPPCLHRRLPLTQS